MDKEFVPYEIAVELKDLGFDEPVFAVYGYAPNDFKRIEDEISYLNEIIAGESNSRLNHNDIRNSNIGDDVSSPLFQQAFRWFREKHNLKSCIIFRHNMEDDENYYDWLIQGEKVVYRHFNSYEEAELSCLKKLIEIVKQKNEIK